MADNPKLQAENGWQKPHNGRGRGATWFTPPDALPEAELITAAQAVDDNERPEPEIGTEPAYKGAWYRPVPLDEAEALAIDLSEAEAILSPEPEPYLGQFDPSRSKLLQGIQPDLGQFDDGRSGKLPGLGAFDEDITSHGEPPIAFDDSKSGRLPGIGTGELEVITGEDEPAIAFDDSKSGLLSGIGTDEGEPIATQVLSDTGALAVEAPIQDQFGAVEDQVTALREQYNQGHISREQLQDELRRLMILDDAGRWWMLGMESNKWYRHDGHDWVQDEPPRQVMPTSADAVPTATGMQEVVAAGGITGFGGEDSSQMGYYTGDDSQLPLRVPIDDADATLVGQSAIRLDEHAPFAAPTQEGLHAHSPLDQTIPGVIGATPGEGSPPYQAGESGQQSAQDSQPVAPPARKMDGIQPDYSEAFAGHWDRAALQKWGVRAAIFGGVGTLALIFIAVIGALIFYLALINRYSAAIDDLQTRASSFQSTIIFDGAGNRLADINDPDSGRRIRVPLENVSPWVIHATVSTEDQSFYENPGFSMYAIIRAIFFTATTSSSGGGATTITQEIAQALVLDPELAQQRSFRRKIDEIIVASEIARRYSKNEILEIYLNEIYYGNFAYGIEAAARTYFGKSANQLTPGEAAMIAGLPNAPALWDPVTRRSDSIRRMDVVLGLMTRANGTGCIRVQHDITGYGASNPLCFTEEDRTNTYVVDIAQVMARNYQRPQFGARYPHFVQYVYRELEDVYGPQRIYSSGFRVYTTVNPSVQDAAQNAVNELLPRQVGANNASVVAIRPSDGAILAMVGSANFGDDSIDGQVNVAFTLQQPGSSIKPFAYLAAFQGRADGQYRYPGTVLWDVPSNFNGYQPRNFSGGFTGPRSTRYMLGQSLNIPAVETLQFVGTEAFQRTLESIGIQTRGETAVQAGLPSVLGAIDVYLYDMVRGYAAFANGGIRHETYAISRVEDSNGVVVFQAEANPAGVRVMEAEHAYLITSILSDPSVKLTQFLNVPGWSAAAKTGTTNDNRDLWTLGYTTEVAVGVWVGRTDNQPLSGNATGSIYAAPIWQRTMQAAVAGLQARDFPRPPGIVTVTVCSDTGAIYTTETCPFGSPVNEVASERQQPPQPGEGYLRQIEVDAFTGLLPNPACPDSTAARSFINIDNPDAITWINTNAAGNQWAQARGITIPVEQPPTQQASGECARITISNPTPNQQVSGLFVVQGTVDVPNFSSYQFYIANASIDPNAFTALQPVYNTRQPSLNSTLGTVEFTNLENGPYILRLVVRGQSGEGSTDVPITVNNAGAAPGIPTSTPAPTLTPDFFAPPTATIEVPDSTFPIEPEPPDNSGVNPENFQIVPTPG